MVETLNEPVLDSETYQAKTDELIDSMEETTALLSEMSSNMAQLSDCFENFGENKKQLRDARTQVQHSRAPTAAD